MLVLSSCIHRHVDANIACKCSDSLRILFSSLYAMTQIYMLIMYSEKQLPSLRNQGGIEVLVMQEPVRDTWPDGSRLHVISEWGSRNNVGSPLVPAVVGHKHC